jgi:hypothetical protein
MSMTAIEILNGEEYAAIAEGWYLANKGVYILLATNIGCPYETTDKKLKPDTPYEVIQYYMGGLREVCREIPNHGYQYDWDLYKIPHTDVPAVENPEKWLYVEPKKIAPPRIKSVYAHKEF